MYDVFDLCLQMKKTTNCNREKFVKEMYSPYFSLKGTSCNKYLIMLNYTMFTT